MDGTQSKHARESYVSQDHGAVRIREVREITAPMAANMANAYIDFSKMTASVLAARHGSGQPAERVFVYAAGGYYAPSKGLAELQDEMRSYLDLGYTVVKMKIGGAPLDEDLRRIEAVLQVVGEGPRLAVDANG